MYTSLHSPFWYGVKGDLICSNFGSFILMIISFSCFKDYLGQLLECSQCERKNHSLSFSPALVLFYARFRYLNHSLSISLPLLYSVLGIRQSYAIWNWLTSATFGCRTLIAAEFYCTHTHTQSQSCQTLNGQSMNGAGHIGRYYSKSKI